MNTLFNSLPDPASVCTDLEYELCRLTKEYEQQGFKHYFYLENGFLVCGDYNLVLNKPVITVHENRYYPKREGIPYGFCLYAITVRNAYCLFNGIFLLSQGFFIMGEISGDVERQLELNHRYPQLFKTAGTSGK